MVIVSQNKEHAINSEYLREIRVYENIIKADIYEDYEVTLGEYKTEERAKKFFQEVVERHSNWESLKAGQPSGICTAIYVMPEDKED